MTDYKKKYKEALERAKQIQSTPYTAHWDVMKDVVEQIFPELKESEDERVRKEILDFCKNRAEKYSNDPKYKNISAWIAWLEKRGEQKPAENKGMNLDEEEMTPFQKKVFCIIDTTIEEEQGLKQVCDELFALASNEIKQKPAWSEEDENINECIQWTLIDKQVKEKEPNKYNREINWLKSLKDRVQPQPKQKWSKKDEVLLKFSLENLTELKNRFGEEYGKVGDCINWLKSLRPQTSWKPSDEQMDALETATSSLQSTALKSLYNYLQKFKG